jgi:aspartyl-tRNA(Asn)/glutamyl-tRNA(Gln) amidotransferase subunit C
MALHFSFVQYEYNTPMLTPEQVERVAMLARLTLSDEEKKRYARQLSAILDYAAQIESVDVGNVPPTSTVLPIRNVMREHDLVEPELTRAQVLKNAPKSDGMSFEVPAVIVED